MSATAALAAEGLFKRFGGLAVTDGVDFRLPHGARHALIGPNGAGKSTLINLLSGVLKPSRGRVVLHGEDVTALSTERRVARGLARTFQVNQLFPELTPLEAVTLAVCRAHGIDASFRSLRRCDDAIDRAYAILGMLRLQGDYARLTTELPYGRQRLLEIALALAGDPHVLLLDEPAAGVPRDESAEIFEAIALLPSDIAVLFIEHDIDLVFRFAERITVLVAGRILCEGEPREIAVDPDVRRVYLGDDRRV